MKLYVDVERKKGERVTTFLKKCYQMNKVDFKFKKTYFDINLTKTQCFQANRSFEDLHTVIKTYYPNCSEEHLAKQIEKLLRYNKKLKLLYCTDINKWVFMNIIYMSNSSNKYKYLYNYNNSESKLNNKGKGKYSYYDLMGLMGFSEEQCLI